MTRMANVDVTLTAGKGQIDSPIVWRLGKEFGVKVNIRRASVDADSGFLQLELEGPIEEIQRATAWLMTTGLHIEAKQRAVGAF